MNTLVLATLIICATTTINKIIDCIAKGSK